MWNRPIESAFWGLLLVLGLGGGWGCGEDTEGRKGRVVLVGEGAGDGNTWGDAGGEEVGEVRDGEGDCDAEQACGEDVEEPVSSCRRAVDLGLLVAGQAVWSEVEVRDDEGSWLETGCAADGSGAEAVFRLQVGEPMRLSFEVVEAEGFDGVMELRAGACGQAGEVQFCSDGESQVFVAEAGVEYFLVVESRSGGEVGTLGLRVQAERAVCAPAGAWRCEEASRVQCFGGVEERIFACAGGCEEGMCLGDRCENALEVKASATFVGQTAGYSNAFDFSEQPSCSSSGAVGMRTAGQDVVFALPDLRAGQTVFVDALTRDVNDNVIAVLNSCNVQAGCVAASSSGDQLVWEVVEDGDYYVVIDKTTATARDFQYRIEINP